MGWINGLELPARHGRGLLQRWATYTGATVTALDYKGVSSKPSGRRKPRLGPLRPPTIADAIWILIRAIIYAAKYKP